MDPKEQDLIAFLRKIPDRFLLPEAARRMVARRKPGSPRRAKKLRQCVFCPEFFGFNEMRLHVAAAHPGGKRSHTPILQGHGKRKLGRPCPKCGIIFGSRELKKHIRDDHNQE